MANYYLGKDAKMYYGDALLDGSESADVAEVDWTEATNVKNVSIDLSKAEADVTTRANTGWRALVGTLKEMSVEFEMVYKDSDAFLTAIKNAYIDDTEISMLVLTGDEDTAGHQGPAANFNVVDFSRGEDLEDAIVHNVTLKASSYQQWYTVSS